MTRQKLTPASARMDAMAATADLLTVAQDQLDEGSFSGPAGQLAAITRAEATLNRALVLLKAARS